MHIIIVVYQMKELINLTMLTTCNNNKITNIKNIILYYPQKLKNHITDYYIFRIK
jgi:hypothetical protein